MERAAPDPGPGAPGAQPTGVRLCELMGVMSLATDLGTGAPLECGLAVCRMALAIGDRMGLAEEDLRRVYYLALLRHIGCTVKSEAMAMVMGDDLTLGGKLAPLDLADNRAVAPVVLGEIRHNFPTWQFPVRAVRAAMFGARVQEGFIAICEVAQIMADRMGFDARFQADIALTGERWDGKGGTGRVRGEDLPPTVRAVYLAEGVDWLRRSMEHSAIGEVVRGRRETMYAPDAVDAFLPAADEIVTSVSKPGSIWDDVMAEEPGAEEGLSSERLAEALRAMGDFADLKSHYLLGHSSGVAALASAAARGAGMGGDAEMLYRAGLVHDIGRVGVNSRIWSTDRPLSADDWEQVRLHAYYTDRVVGRPAALKGVSQVASMHHERLDGSGYFRALPGGALGAPARLLAAADAFRAMQEPRPHRPAMDADQAARVLRDEVRAGRIDGDAADAVLAAAGQRPRKRREQVAGLTEREVEVLRLLARGATKREIARQLVISPKTADAHVQHIYTKAGVSTRPAATMFALRHGLLDASDSSASE
ncbi:MAG TPA: HD domain-containing phosphohydrolase [Actinomycetota bacterium]|nr:HD domain-containing phosphohydrolase [Actinomycetota bacterium]